MSREFYDEHKIYKFDFSKSKAAYVVDEINYTGLYLADFMVETDKAYMIIEFKNPNHPKAHEEDRKYFLNEILGATKKSNHDILDITKSLSFELGCKFKDTILLKWSEEFEFNKPVHYIFILNDDDIDAGVLSHFEDRVKGSLPLRIENHANIKKKMIESFTVLNISIWNKQFMDFPIIKIA